MTTPLKPLVALTDQQMDVLYRLSWPLTPAARSAFLASVMEALQKQPTIGDGTLYRVACEMQRRYWAPPDLSAASRSRAY
jgi:hypothetical protein